VGELTAKEELIHKTKQEKTGKEIETRNHRFQIKEDMKGIWKDLVQVTVFLKTTGTEDIHNNSGDTVVLTLAVPLEEEVWIIKEAIQWKTKEVLEGVIKEATQWEIKEAIQWETTKEVLKGVVKEAIQWEIKEAIQWEIKEAIQWEIKEASQGVVKVDIQRIITMVMPILLQINGRMEVTKEVTTAMKVIILHQILGVFNSNIKDHRVKQIYEVITPNNAKPVVRLVHAVTTEEKETTVLMLQINEAEIVNAGLVVQVGEERDNDHLLKPNIFLSRMRFKILSQT
jgi:hypothetical protein